jgi:hypothetical protein
MEHNNVALTHDEALELLAYLLSSTQGGLKEPSDYAIYRLITAAERLARVWAPRTSGTLSEFLQNLAVQAPTEAAKLITGPSEFQEFLAEQISNLAQEVRLLEVTGGTSNEP